MRYLTLSFFIFLALFLFAPRAHSQNVRDVYKAIKNIEVKCEVGTTKKEYKAALADAVLEFNIYKELNKDNELVPLFSKILEHYRNAGKAWDEMDDDNSPLAPFSRKYGFFSSLDDPMFYILQQKYPVLAEKTTGDPLLLEINTVLSTIWGIASEEISRIPIDRLK